MIKKRLDIIIPLIYLILCILISFLRVPFWDEARAWLISANCNLGEFLDMMKLECHTFVWYLAIFPFAKTNFLYPYSMYLVNTLFSCFAIFILWKRAPFSILQKIFITFSTPFLFLWGSVARCYSVGILFLFMALGLYKVRNKKPFLYLSFLCLSLNTSIMAFIGAFYLGVIFLFENYKKKNFYSLCAIFLFSIFIVLIQIYDPNPDYLKQLPEMTFFRDFLAFIFHPIFFIALFPLQSVLMSLLRFTSIITAFVFIFYCAKNNKKALFFLLSSYFSMIILFVFFYSGNFWHYFYFYLYFIVAIWILKAQKPISKTLDICFYIILFLCIFKGSMFIDSKLTTINNSTSKYIAKEILENPLYKNKKLYCIEPWSDVAPSALPYLKNISIYDKDGIERKTAKSMRKQIEFNMSSFNPDEFAKHNPDGGILVSAIKSLEHEKNNPARIESGETIIFKGEKSTVEFIPLSKNDDIHLWSYLIKVNN